MQSNTKKVRTTLERAIDMLVGCSRQLKGDSEIGSILGDARLRIWRAIEILDEREYAESQRSEEDEAIDLEVQATLDRETGL